MIVGALRLPVVIDGMIEASTIRRPSMPITRVSGSTTAAGSPFRPIRRRHLALLGQVARIQHGLQDQSTFLGYLWSFLHPLITLLVLYAIFSQRIGEGIPHYAIYLLIGLVQFAHFSKSTTTAMRVLHRMRGLATSVMWWTPCV